LIGELRKFLKQKNSAALREIKDEKSFANLAGFAIDQNRKKGS